MRLTIKKFKLIIVRSSVDKETASARFGVYRLDPMLEISDYLADPAGMRRTPEVLA
jgi:hypothetical protein